MFTYSVIGFGARGQLYSKFLNKEGAKITAVCDFKQKRLDEAVADFGAKNENCYLDENEFFSKGKLSDLLIISTLDQNHYKNAIEAIKLGYDILLEKPIAQNLEECETIAKLAHEKGVKIFICYVLRYAPFFIEIKNQLDSGKFGKIATLNLTENVAYWHQAHSFVRGNWRDTKETTPMIVAKCCHDLDIISWIMNDTPVGVSSMGELSFFKKENAPEGSGNYCFECTIKDKCPYECSHFYKKYPWWLSGVGIYRGDPEDKKAIEECLKDKNNPYSRCVFKCDNDAVDHQVTNILFENGSTAHLTMTAFADDCYRDIHIHCTYGEIYGNMVDNKITCKIFGGEKWVIDLNKLGGIDGHGGGDPLMIHELCESYNGKNGMKGAIDEALMSHKLGFLADASCKQGGKLLKY